MVSHFFTIVLCQVVPSANLTTLWHIGTALLSWAAENGRKWIVIMLLERKDVNPNHAGTRSGRTPLLLAAENGHEGTVKVLLEREDVDPDHADTQYDQTPLS